MVAYLIAPSIITSILLLIIPRNKIKLIKQLTLACSLITLWLSLKIWLNYEPGTIFQYNHVNYWIDNHIFLKKWGPIHFGVDQISLPFILLTNLLIPICILISWISIKHLVKEFLLSILVIQLLLIGVFSSFNILLFYILFEIILIPMFIIIGIWGSRKEKEKAAYYFFFYTLAGSLMMLLGIFYIYASLGTLDYQLLINNEIPKNIQMWCFLGFFLSLAVKIPMIPFHIWLPQAHVEAPVAGSVLLAGILLKLGGYGFIRFVWNLFPIASEYATPFIMLLSAIAVLYASFSTCRQTDAKRLIAYSSIAHMGIVTIAIFSKTLEGVMAAILLMVAHGLVSSGLFIIVTNFYDRFHTKLIRYYRGMSYTMPILSTFFFLLVLGNIAFPLSLNFIGEFTSLISAIQLSWVVASPVLIGMVLSASYSLIIYNKISFGIPSSFIHQSRDITRREFHSPLILSLLTIILGLTPLTIITSYKLPILL